MKTILGVVAIALIATGLSVSPTYGDASQNGCEHSKNRAAGCSDNDEKKYNRERKDAAVVAPEPGSLGLLAAGIVGVACLGYAISRKRVLEN
jgi:hypothetical protein